MTNPSLSQVLNETMGEVVKQLTLIGKALAKTRQLLGGGDAPVLDADFEVQAPKRKRPAKKEQRGKLTLAEAQRRRAEGLRRWARKQKRLKEQGQPVGAIAQQRAVAPQQIDEIL